MYRVHKTNFVANTKTIDKLFELNRLSAEVWNECLRLSKEYHLEHGKWIPKKELRNLMKKRFTLHSQSVQAILDKYIWSRDNTLKAKRKGYSNQRYPYKTKKHYNTKWAKDGFVLHSNGKVELKLGLLNQKRQKPLVVWVKSLPKGVVKEIELVFDRELKLCMSYEDGVEFQPNTGHRTVAIDIGEIHSLTAIHEDGEAIMITGRKLRSVKRLRNKKVAELQRKMSKCKKGSKQWKKYNRAKQYISSKSVAQLTDSLHKTTKNFVDWCLKEQVKEVVIGDVEGVQRHTSKRKKKNRKVRSKKHNQRMSQWQFGKLQDYLKYKLATFDIQLHKIDESYTTQTCPACGRKKKVSSRNYKCHCGYKQHRDIHSAINIWSKYIYGDIRWTGIQLENLTYLRIA